MNTERYPNINPSEKSNALVNKVIKGTNSIVSDSAVNVYESGADNFIGPNCKNISVFNSSGCTVPANTIGATILNSSGVTITEDNQTWINNSLSDKRTHVTAGITPFVLISIPVTSGAILIDATILGLRSDTSGGYVGKITAGFRIEAGNLILINSGWISNSTEDANVTTGAISAQVTGTNAQIYITPANTTVSWSVTYTVQKI